MRKSETTTKKIIAELEKHGNVFNACGKVRVSTSTYYRWLQEDPEFMKIANEAKEIGRLNITDFTESKLIQNVGKGDQRAVEFHLKANNPRYATNLSRKQINELMEEFRKENDTSEEQNYLKYLITNMFSLCSIDDIRQKLMAPRQYNGESLESCQNRDSKGYANGMSASEFVESLIDRFGDDIRAIEGTQKKRPSWGTRMHDRVCDMHANPEEAAKYGDSHEKEYKEKRRDEIRKWNIERGIPADEGIDF